MKLTPRRMKWLLNLYPPYLFSRTRITYIAPDWKKVVVTVRKSALNRNYFGTIFGGTLYAATDPHLVLMLTQILGIKDYIIWDQGAEILFKKPGRSDVTFTFTLTDEQIRSFREQTEALEKIRPEITVEGRDQEGDVCVIVKKILYIRKKQRD